MKTSSTGRRTSGTDLRDLGLDLPGMDTLAAAGRVPPPEQRVVAEALAAVRAAGEREQAAPGGVRVRRPGRRTVAVAAVLAGAAAAAVLPTVGFGGGRPGASAQAAEFLTSMAAKGGAPGLGGAPYWKVSTLVGGDQPPSAVNTYYNRTTYTEEMATGLAAEPWARKTAHARPGTSTLLFGDATNAVHWDDLASLPTDPAELARRLEGDWSDGIGTFQVVSEALGSAPVSPQVRSALFQVLARMPGVRLVGAAHDATGRTGTELSLTDHAGTANAGTVTIIVDPHNGRLLEQELADSRQDLRVTYLSAGPAARIG